jgi:hypothetical protein
MLVRVPFFLIYVRTTKWREQKRGEEAVSASAPCFIHSFTVKAERAKRAYLGGGWDLEVNNMVNLINV